MSKAQSGENGPETSRLIFMNNFIYKSSKSELKFRMNIRTEALHTLLLAVLRFYNREMPQNLGREDKVRDELEFHAENSTRVLHGK